MQDASQFPHYPFMAGNYVVTDKIAVIIPFYQEEPGILRRALRSVCDQREVKDIDIVIVDDGSRIPARQELRNFFVPSHIQVRILEQDNAGPGAARNRGLDNVTNDTKYVAFLDSDDEWTADHLRRAVTALAKGYDFYFSNYFAIGQVDSAFERNEDIDIGLHPRISEQHDIHEYCGDFFSQQVLKPVIHTSTVVYRYAKFPDIRFPEWLRYGSEDQLCWLDFAARKAMVAFSSRPECHCGRAINISRVQWGTEKALKSLHNSIVFRKEIQKRHALDEELLTFNARRLREARQELASNFLHIIRHRKPISCQILFKHFTGDPISMYWCLNVAGLVTLHKIRSFVKLS